MDTQEVGGIFALLSPEQPLQRPVPAMWSSYCACVPVSAFTHSVGHWIEWGRAAHIVHWNLVGWGLLSAWAGQELGGEAEKSFFSMADTQEVGGGALEGKLH